MYEPIISSVEKAMIETYPAEVFTGRVEDISETLWGASVSASTMSNLNGQALEALEEWRSRPLTCGYPYLFLNGIYLKKSWRGALENVVVMVAIDINDDGHREVIGLSRASLSQPDVGGTSSPGSRTGASPACV